MILFSKMTEEETPTIATLQAEKEKAYGAFTEAAGRSVLDLEAIKRYAFCSGAIQELNTWTLSDTHASPDRSVAIVNTEIHLVLVRNNLLHEWTKELKLEIQLAVSEGILSVRSESDESI